MDTLDTLMSAIVEAVAIGRLAWATLTSNKRALQAALKILLYARHWIFQMESQAP